MSFICLLIVHVMRMKAVEGMKVQTVYYAHTYTVCVPAHVKGLIKCAACVCVFI